jgi:hypothetical protein
MNEFGSLSPLPAPFFPKKTRSLVFDLMGDTCQLFGFGHLIVARGATRCTNSSVTFRLEVIEAKARFAPETWQKERFAPLPAVSLAEWRAGSLGQLSFLRALPL